MKKLHARLEDLSNRAYIFSINTLSFVKSIQKKGIQVPNANKLLKAAGKIADILLETADNKNIDDTRLDLTMSDKQLKVYSDLLQTIEVEGLLANEKADLHIDSFEIQKEIAELLEFVKK